MSHTLIEWKDDEPKTTFESRVHGIIRRLTAGSKQTGLQSSLIAVLYPPPSDHDDPDIQIELSFSHTVTHGSSNALDAAMQHPLQEVVCLSGGLGQLTQGFKLHCPACGYVSTALHNHHQLQQALSCSHPKPKSGQSCNHCCKLHKDFDLLQTHPATRSLSTGPQHKVCQDPQHTAADAGRKPNRRQKQGQAGSNFQGSLIDEALAKRVMGLILANMAMHIITVTPSGRSSKPAHAGSAGQRLSPWRPWAVRTLTESVDVIEAANWVRPSFATLLAAFSMPAQSEDMAAGPDSQPSPSTALDSSTGAVSILDLLLAPPWAAVSESHAIKNMCLERLAAFVKQWFCWLQQHRPSEAEAAEAALSNNGHMLARRTAGMQLLLEGLLALDLAFKHHPAATRLQHFLACAGISGSVDAVLVKLDKVIRAKTHITTHLEACAYCGLSSAKLRVFCKASGGKKTGNTGSSMCKCNHCIVAVCVPCVLAAAGMRAAEDAVAHGSIGEAEAAEAAAHWPDGLCYWCSSAQQGLLLSPAVSPQKAAAPARAELLLQQQDTAGAIAGAASRPVQQQQQQQAGDRAREATAAAFPQGLLQRADDAAAQAAVAAFPPQQQQLLQEALQAVLSAFSSQAAAAAQPQGSQPVQSESQPALEHPLLQDTQMQVLQRQSSHSSLSADGSRGAAAAADVSGAGAPAGRFGTNSSTDDSAFAAAADWVPSSKTAAGCQQQQRQQELIYWASDDLDAEQPQRQQQQLGEGAECCAPCDSPEAQVAATAAAAAAGAAAAAAAGRPKRGFRQPRCGNCYSCLNRHLKKGCYEVKAPPGFKRKMELEPTDSGHHQKKPRIPNTNQDAAAAAAGSFGLTTLQMPALPQQQRYAAQQLAPAPLSQQPWGLVECTYVADKCMHAADDAAADLFEVHGAVACVTRKRSSSVGKAFSSSKLDALATAAAAAAAADQTTVAPVFAPAAVAHGGAANGAELLQASAAATGDDSSPDVTPLARAGPRRIRHSSDSSSMGAGTDAPEEDTLDIDHAGNPSAPTDLDTAVYTALSAAATRLSGAAAVASPGHGQAQGQAAASGGAAQAAGDAGDGASSGADSQDEPPVKATKRCATCLVNSWSSCGTDNAHEHCLRRLQQQQQLQDAQQQEARSPDTQQQLQQAGSGPGSSAEPSETLHIQPSEQDLHAKFTQLMQALLGADGPFARQVAGTLAMGVAAGVATESARQSQDAAVDEEGAAAAAGLEQLADPAQQEDAAEGSPAPPQPDNAAAAAAAAAGSGGVQGPRRAEGTQGSRGSGGAAGSGRPRRPPVYKPRSTRQQRAAAAAGADWGAGPWGASGLRSLLDPAVGAGAWAAPAAAAAAGGAACMQGKQHCGLLLTCFDDQEHQALMALLDMRHLKEEQQIRRQQRQQQHQQVGDQGGARGMEAGGQQAPSWWLEQQQRLLQVQQEADWGLLPAASVTWPWDGQPALSYGHVVTTERGTPQAEAEAVAAPHALLAAAAGLIHPAAAAAGFLDPAAAAAAPVDPAALAAAPVNPAAAAAADPVLEGGVAGGIHPAAAAAGASGGASSGAFGGASMGMSFVEGQGVQVPWAVSWSGAELSEHNAYELMYRHQVIQDADRPTRHSRQVTTSVLAAAAEAGDSAAAAVLDAATAVAAAAGDAVADGDAAAADRKGPESPAAANRRSLIALCEEVHAAAAAAGTLPAVTDGAVPASSGGALGETQASSMQQEGSLELQAQGSAAAPSQQQQPQRSRDSTPAVVQQGIQQLQAQGSAAAVEQPGIQQLQAQGSAAAVEQQGIQQLQAQGSAGEGSSDQQQQQQTHGIAPAVVQAPPASYPQMLEAAAANILQRAAATNIMQQAATANILQQMQALQFALQQPQQQLLLQQRGSGPQAVSIQDLSVQAQALEHLPDLPQVPQAHPAQAGTRQQAANVQAAAGLGMQAGAEGLSQQNGSRSRGSLP